MLTPTTALHWGRKITRNRLRRRIFFFTMGRNYKRMRGHKLKPSFLNKLMLCSNVHVIFILFYYYYFLCIVKRLALKRISAIEILLYCIIVCLERTG